ncbi:hypothetical protein MNBD_ALPHA02-319 [hydrothermal vent metagenome]|uniref:J domain-containing protein n=1 Tax=hydrothermal vent metagenome TaxID=652676 RepID=A0A3B0RU00_9ZZZZ
MPFILTLAGFVFLLYMIARFLKQSKSEKLNRLFRIGFAVILGLLAFLILVRGNIAVGGILGLLSFLSAQGSLWTFFTSDPSVSSGRPNLSNSPMTRTEALDILELSGHPGSSEIKDAHHRMMLKYHPDQGGSDYFASKLNQARDILL